VDLPGFPFAKIIDLDGMEDRKDYAKAKAGYELVYKTAGLPVATKRYVETRYFLIRARLLDEADDATRTADTPALVQDLEQFLLNPDHAKGWEVWPIGRALARIYADQGKYSDVVRTWSKLHAKESLSKELKDEAMLREIDAHIRDGKFSQAASRAAELAKSPPTADSAKERLAIYPAASKGGTTDPSGPIKEIEAIIAKAKDSVVRAVGYSMIGELNLAAKKDRDAMWAFLWVEVVFKQDRDEVLTAMQRLIKLFETMDKDRVEPYKERLRKYRAES
jgi:hypothetical protein